MAIELFSEVVKKNNMLFGILICALTTSLLFLILPLSAFFIGDIFLILGNCLGLIFSFKNRKETQQYIKTGVIVGLIGSILSLFFICFFVWIIYYLNTVYDLLFFLRYIFLSYVIFYVIVGLIAGYLFGNRYKKREDPDRIIPRF